MRREKGITLIALVITIIVLLILAGVSIAMLTGENGILTQAKKAKEETEKAAEEEERQLSELESIITEEAPKVTDDTPGELAGGGTEENPYKIESVEDLVEFIKEINDGNGENFVDEHVELVITLDLASENSYNDPSSTIFGDYNGDGQTKGLYEEINDKNYTGLQLAYDLFQGKLDGKGNEIRNIYSKIDEVYGEYGFIAYNDGGIIKDLTLRGEYEITGTTPDYFYAGGLTGYNKNGEISNCKTDINIIYNLENKELEGNTRVGALVGINSGSIKNCVNEGEILVNLENNTQNVEEVMFYVGGAIGENRESGIVDSLECHGKIDINMSIDLVASGNYKIVRVGGIVGSNDGKIINSTNYADINVDDIRLGESADTSVKLGGIVGNNNENAEVVNVINYGNITGSTDDLMSIGGIVGDDESGANSIKNVYNKGTIEGTATTENLKLGGIVGVFGNATMDRVYNAGKVIANSETKYIGGIIGDIYGTVTLTNSKYLSSTASGAAQGAEIEGIERADSLTAGEIKDLLNEGVRELNIAGDLKEWTNVQ